MAARKPWNNDRSHAMGASERFAYERAADIAGRSGLSVAAWLNGVISDVAGEAGHDDVRQRQSQHGSGGRQNARLSKMFQRLADLTERVSSAEIQAQRALQLAEHRLQDADRRGRVTTRHVDDFETEVNHVHSDLAEVEREARMAVRELVGETRALGRDSGRDDPRLSAIVRAIGSVEDRLDSINLRLNQPLAREQHSTDDGRLAKIEAQLVDIARQLHQPPTNISPSAGSDLSETVRQIASRQRELDHSGDTHERQHGGAGDLHRDPFLGPGDDGHPLRDIHDRLSALADQISEERRRPHFDERLSDLPERFETLRRSVERAQPDAQIERLVAEIRQLDGKISEAKRCGMDGAGLTRIEAQIDDMRSALRAGEFAGLASEIKALGERLDHLQPRQDIVTIERLREDISGLRAELSERHAQRSAVPGDGARHFDELRQRIDHIQSLLSSPREAPEAIHTLSERIDALARQLLSSSGSDATHRMIAELRRRVEELVEQRPAPEALSAIEQRLLTLVGKIDGERAGIPVADPALRDVETRLKRLTELLEVERQGPSSETMLQSLEKHFSDLRRTSEGSDRRLSETLTSVHDALARLSEKMAPNGAGEVVPAAARPGAALPAAAKPEPRTAEPITPDRKPARPPAAEPKRSANPEKQALNAAREAAARAVELQRGDADRGEADLPLEPGSGRPSSRPQSPMSRLAAPRSGDGLDKPLRAEDPIRAARIAMQKKGGDDAAPAKSAGLRSVFISLLRRKAADKDIDEAADRMAEAVAKSAARPVGAKAKSGKLPVLLLRIAVGAAILVIVLSAVRIVLSLGQGGGEAVAPAREERPVGDNRHSPSSNLAALSDPIVTSSIAPRSEDSRNRGKADGAVAGTGEVFLPPLPDGLTSQRLKQAIEARNPRAFFDLGIRLAEGRSLPRDVEAAIPWLVLAAEHGHAPAYYRLGNIYEKGLGPRRDIKEALAAYRKGAELGNRKSMHNLATLYAAGTATGTPDYDTAFPFFEQASELGLVDSQFNLAVLLVNGLGARQNLPEAYKWFAIAAQNGDREAGKKRDEIATKLTGQALVDARLSAQNFRAKTLVAAANEDTPQTLLFDDNPLASNGTPAVQASPNLGISVAPTRRGG